MLNVLRTLIIEDEPRNQKALHILLQQHCPHIEVVQVCNNAKEAITAVAQWAPDLVFLDIRMPGLSGFEFLDAFIEPPFEIIFVTAYEQYAVQALRCSAVDYLMKPVVAADLVRAVKKAGQRIDTRASKTSYQILLENHHAQNATHQKLVVPTREGLEFIAMAQVTKLKADRNYTHIYTVAGKETISTHHLKHYEKALPPGLFIRTHHSYIINLKHVKSYVRGEGGHVVLADGTTADVSKRRKKDFLEAFGQ